MKPLAIALSAALLAAGCSSGGSATAADPDRMPVTAAFYPLQFASERVGGDHVQVGSLTKPGAEPHDLELTPKAVTELASSRVVVYLKGFQPAVDEAVATQVQDAGFDVAPSADLTLAAREDGHAGETEAEHADDEGATDPHFWLDPVRLAKVATALGERFASADPANAASYRANAATLADELRTLDAEFERALAACASRDLVTSHAAFGYLANRYDLTQEGIAGINPDAEPDAATMRDLAAHVRENEVPTVYSETLVSPALAATLARETGARMALLDPIEGITDASNGKDYLEVMRSNLATLKKGQECS